MRTAAKRDANERQIVDALRRVGATIQRLSGAGGLPDLLVGWRGSNWLLEVKTPRGQYRRGQLVWMARWRGQSATVRSVDEALTVIGAMYSVTSGEALTTVEQALK